MQEKLDNIIIEILDLDEGELSDDLTPETAEYWDSLNHLRMISAIEQAFDIKLTMEEIQSIESIGELRQTIARHLGTP